MTRCSEGNCFSTEAKADRPTELFLQYMASAITDETVLAGSLNPFKEDEASKGKAK